MSLVAPFYVDYHYQSRYYFIAVGPNVVTVGLILWQSNLAMSRNINAITNNWNNLMQLHKTILQELNEISNTRPEQLIIVINNNKN